MSKVDLSKPTVAEGARAGVSTLLDVLLKVTVELGRTHMAFSELIELAEGSIIELDRLAGEPLEIKIAGKLIAHGEAVVVNGKLGFRIVEVIANVRNDIAGFGKAS